MDHASLQPALARAASEHARPQSLHVPWPWEEQRRRGAACRRSQRALRMETSASTWPSMKWVRSLGRAGICLTLSCPNQVGGSRGVQQSILRKEGVNAQYGEFVFPARSTLADFGETAPGAYRDADVVFARWAVARAAALPTARPRGPPGGRARRRRGHRDCGNDLLHIIIVAQPGLSGIQSTNVCGGCWATWGGDSQTGDFPAARQAVPHVGARPGHVVPACCGF